MLRIIFIINLIFSICVGSPFYKCEVHDYSMSGAGCELSLETFQDGNKVIELWDGNLEEKSNLTLADMNWIDIELSEFLTSPKILFDSFDNLNRIDISESTGLNNLGDVPFFNKNLSRVAIFKSDLTAIGEMTFQNLSKLVEMKLMDNLINRIHKNAFKDLIQLKILDLSFNKLESLDDELFAFNLELESVIISFNNLKRITTNSFVFTEKLQRIDFERNQINEIENGFLVNVNDLEILDLRSNVCADNLINKESHKDFDDLLQICYKNFKEHSE